MNISFSIHRKFESCRGGSKLQGLGRPVFCIGKWQEQKEVDSQDATKHSRPVLSAAREKSRFTESRVPRGSFGASTGTRDKMKGHCRVESSRAKSEEPRASLRGTVGI